MKKAIGYHLFLLIGSMITACLSFIILSDYSVDKWLASDDLLLTSFFGCVIYLFCILK